MTETNDANDPPSISHSISAQNRANENHPFQVTTAPGSVPGTTRRIYSSPENPDWQNQYMHDDLLRQIHRSQNIAANPNDDGSLYTHETCDSTVASNEPIVQPPIQATKTKPPPVLYHNPRFLGTLDYFYPRRLRDLQYLL